MKKQIFFLSIAIFFTVKINAQVGINDTNTAPNASAMLDVSSTTKGFLPPRMTSAQRTVIFSPADGLLVFDSDTQSYWFRQSGAWVELPKNNYWQLNGSAGNEIKNINSGGFWSANATGLTTLSDDSSNPPIAPSTGAGTRMMWIPSRSAFRVGTVDDDSWNATNSGLFSFASGYDTKANGKYSTALGFATIASGKLSTAMGTQTTAGGTYSTAMGYYTTANGGNSTAIGYGTTASNYYATALGASTTASGRYSTAIGSSTIASGLYSTAMGESSTASGSNSTAMGYSTIASGNYSTVIGLFNIDNSNGLFMVGNGTYSNHFTAFIIRKDNNRVGIGMEDPSAMLHVDQFTRLGNDAPAIRMKKFTGNTATMVGGSTTIVHGLTASKILSISIVIDLGLAGNVTEHYTQSSGYQTDISFEATNIYVWNSPANSANILNKPFKVLVTYEQ